MWQTIPLRGQDICRWYWWEFVVFYFPYSTRYPMIVFPGSLLRALGWLVKRQKQLWPAARNSRHLLSQGKTSSRQIPFLICRGALRGHARWVTLATQSGTLGISTRKLMSCFVKVYPARATTEMLKPRMALMIILRLCFTMLMLQREDYSDC